MECWLRAAARRADPQQGSSPRHRRLLPLDLLRNIPPEPSARDEDGERVRGFLCRKRYQRSVQPSFHDVPRRMSEAQLVESADAGASSVADISIIGRPSS